MAEYYYNVKKYLFIVLTLCIASIHTSQIIYKKPKNNLRGAKLFTIVTPMPHCSGLHDRRNTMANGNFTSMNEFAMSRWPSDCEGMTSEEERMYDLELDIAKADWIEQRAKKYRIGDEDLPLIEDRLLEERVLQRFMLQLETSYKLNCPLKTARGVMLAVEEFRASQVAIAKQLAEEDVQELSEERIFDEVMP